MSIESVVPSNHLILCRPLLLPPSIFPRFAKSGALLTAFTINRHQPGSEPGCSLWPLCPLGQPCPSCPFIPKPFHHTGFLSDCASSLYTASSREKRILHFPSSSLFLRCFPSSLYLLPDIASLQTAPPKDAVSLPQRRSHRILRWMCPNIT